MNFYSIYLFHYEALLGEKSGWFHFFTTDKFVCSSICLFVAGKLLVYPTAIICWKHRVLSNPTLAFQLPKAVEELGLWIIKLIVSHIVCLFSEMLLHTHTIIVIFFLFFVYTLLCQILYLLFHYYLYDIFNTKGKSLLCTRGICI